MTNIPLFLGYMIVGTFFLGYNDIQNKRCLSKGIDERIMIVVPFIIGGILLLLLIPLFGMPHVGGAFWGAYVGTTLLNVVSQSMFMRAFKLADASLIAPLRLIVPIFVIFTGYIFLHEVPSVTGIVGIFVTMLGLWYLLYETMPHPKHLTKTDTGKGILYGLVGSVLFSISFPLDKITVVQSSAVFASGLVALSVGIIALAFHVLTSERFRTELIGARHEWRALLSVSIVRATSITLTNQALIYSLAAYASSLKRLAALWTVMMSGTFLKEKGIWKKLLATGIMFVGILLSAVFS